MNTVMMEENFALIIVPYVTTFKEKYIHLRTTPSPILSFEIHFLQSLEQRDIIK